MQKTRITIWNEFRHEKNNPAIREIYPEGLHRAIAKGIAADDFEITCVALDDPEQGLPDEILNNTDVLLWWGHCAHFEVKDELVDKVQKRVLEGMGLIVLHSGHMSKIFRRVTGCSGTLKWREEAERERLWNIAPTHPITQGIGEYFEIPHEEMYGEYFDIPKDGNVIFIAHFEGGNVFRSGVTFERGYGKIFYFQPGHESYPIYYQKEVLQVISNAVRWAKPVFYRELDCPRVPAIDKIYSENTGPVTGIVQNIDGTAK